jgi:hypothetical protein
MPMLTLVRKPSAFIPLLMSLTALAIVLGTVAMFGVVHQADEGTAAHLFQLLIAGQLPIVSVFAVKWVARAPRDALMVLGVQAVAGLVALAPVFFLHL